ncbi:MAG: helix-turn-helix transcriptional regulator [Clostridia bacterium]
MNIYKVLRKNKGITQVELARYLNVEQTTVSKWEVDKSTPDYPTMQKLADFYDVTTDYLLGRVAKEIIIIPDSLSNIPVAFAGGISDLTQDDIDDVARYIEFIRAKKTKK